MFGEAEHPRFLAGAPLPLEGLLIHIRVSGKPEPNNGCTRPLGMQLSKSFQLSIIPTEQGYTLRFGNCSMPLGYAPDRR